jgi:hypothetical protein
MYKTKPYQPNPISLFEKVKRIVAHSFNMDTKLERKERFERLAWEEEQGQLKLEHNQYLRTLYIENADAIEAWKDEQQRLADAAAWELEQERIEKEIEKQQEEIRRRYWEGRKLEEAFRKKGKHQDISEEPQQQEQQAQPQQEQQ